jgi:hypothetical protein
MDGVQGSLTQRNTRFGGWIQADTFVSGRQ